MNKLIVGYPYFPFEIGFALYGKVKISEYFLILSEPYYKQPRGRGSRQAQGQAERS